MSKNECKIKLVKSQQQNDMKCTVSIYNYMLILSGIFIKNFLNLS